MTQELFEKLRQGNNPIIEGFTDVDDIFGCFDIPEDPNIQILFASYERCYYDGDATVIYFDKLTNLYYEVNGSHCSCYGLENQWQPSEILFKELDNRINNGFGYGLDRLKELLN